MKIHYMHWWQSGYGVSSFVGSSPLKYKTISKYVPVWVICILVHPWWKKAGSRKYVCTYFVNWHMIMPSLSVEKEIFVYSEFGICEKCFGPIRFFSFFFNFSNCENFVDKIGDKIGETNW